MHKVRQDLESIRATVPNPWTMIDTGYIMMTGMKWHVRTFFANEDLKLSVTSRESLATSDYAMYNYTVKQRHVVG